MKLQLFPKRKITPMDAPYEQSGRYYTDVVENKLARVENTTEVVLNVDYTANSVLAADSAGNPTARTINEQELVGRVTGGTIEGLSTTELANLFHSVGLHHAKACTYVSGTGTAGTDATAQTVKTVTLPANSLTQVGDRIRIRIYWRGDTGGGITATTTLNGVTITHTVDLGATDIFMNETWLHYIDNTHANIVEHDHTTTSGLGALSAVNVAGFDWDSAQDIDVDQDNVANNHIVVFGIFVDVMPKGII